MLEEIKKDIIERLNERIGQEHYLCDLGMILTENENANGSWYCSEYQAKEEIEENFDLCSDFSEWHNDIYGEYKNPFGDPENFHCCMMICAYENVFNQAVSDHKKWNEKIEITEKFIEYIKEHLKDVNEIF